MGNKLTRFTKLMLDVMFYAGIVVTLTLPVSVKIYGQINSYFAQYYVHMIIMFGISGILAELILYELRRIFRTVLENDCFVRANVKSLNRMGTYSFLIALVTVGRLFLYPVSYTHLDVYKRQGCGNSRSNRLCIAGCY